VSFIGNYSPNTNDTDAFEIHFTLESGANPWVVFRFELDKNGYASEADLSGYQYLIVPLKGDPGLSAGELPTLEIKMQDDTGLYALLFTPGEWGNLLTLPATRGFFIPLEKYARLGVHMEKIRAFEFGITHPSGGFSGTLTFDDISASTSGALRDRYSQCGFESVVVTDSLVKVMGDIASDLCARMNLDHHLIPTWYPEPTPLYNIYAESLVLIVLSFEYARTAEVKYKQAAQDIADTLVGIQNPTGGPNPGSWYNAYRDDGTGGLTPDGSEYYVANVGWGIIGLRIFVDNVKPADPSPYAGAMETAADWIATQIGTYSGIDGGVSTGTEANISSYFGLIASKTHDAQAESIASFLMHANGPWKEEEGRFWMGTDESYFAVDVTGNWGAEFNLHRAKKVQSQSEAYTDRALDGLKLAVSVFAVDSWNDGIPMYGLGDIEGPFQPTVEFTAQYIAAQGPGSNALLSELLKLRGYDGEGPGAFKGAPDTFWYGKGWNTDMAGIPPSAWIYFAIRGGFLRDL
jgi:hypothetical protein